MLGDMQTAGLLHLPFDKIAVRFYAPDLLGDKTNSNGRDIKAHVTFSASGALSLIDPPGEAAETSYWIERPLLIPEQIGDPITVEFLSGQIRECRNNDTTADEMKGAMYAACCDALAVLVCALAARNVVKRFEKNTRVNRTNKPQKPQFRGPAGAIYISRTVIELPEQMDDDAEHPARPGSTRRPHMRRGHLHTVLFGVRHRERRRQWFAPIFVNADPNFVAEARRYVVGEMAATDTHQIPAE